MASAAAAEKRPAVRSRQSTRRTAGKSRMQKITTPASSISAARGGRASMSSSNPNMSRTPPRNGSPICARPSRPAGSSALPRRPHSAKAMPTGMRKPTTIVAGWASSPPAGITSRPVAIFVASSTPSTAPTTEVATAARKPRCTVVSTTCRARTTTHAKKPTIVAAANVPITPWAPRS